MLVGFAGGVSLQPGDEHVFPRDEAARLVSAGYAVPAADPAVETAGFDDLRLVTIVTRTRHAAPAPQSRKRRP